MGDEDLSRRLTAKQVEKDRYVRLYAQGHISESELETYLADLKNQTDNLRLLIASVEADLNKEQENKLAAQTTASWIMTLRKNLSEVEQNTQEAYQRRRELVKLLVERITVDRGEDGRAKVQITYRFGPPSAQADLGEGDVFVGGVQNAGRLYNARL